MKQTFFLYILLFCCSVAFGQTGRLSGSVHDSISKAPLELATVSILNPDSSLVTYQLSDRNGKFSLEKLPLKKKLLVSITYVGYSGYHKSIQLDKPTADTLHVFLSLSQNDSNAVVVTASVPIRMNGDTLEINPAAFKVKPDAVVEELLNQVPGITIWSDGSITVNGKKVQNLLVEGKPFLGMSDPRIATQNLPKSAIDKIQLYQEYDRSNIGKENQPQDSLLTMNIKLKEGSKTGYFGKMGAGYGTTRRYESDLSFQMYNKKSSAGIGGGYNNINKSIENLQELFQNNTYRNFNPNLYNVGRFGANGINKNYSIGGVLTQNFIETANSRQNNRLVINYNASGTTAYLTDLNLQNRTTLANPQFIRDEGVQNNESSRHDISVNYVKTNSYNDNLNVNGALHFGNGSGNSSRNTEITDSAGKLQSTNRVLTVQNNRSNDASLSAGFAKSDNEDPWKSFNLQLNTRYGNNVSERDVKSIFQSLVRSADDTSYNRRYTTNFSSFNIGGTLDYSGFKRLILGRYNLFGINLSLSQWFNFTQQSSNSVVNDYDSTSKEYVTNTRISNFNKREIFEYTPSLSLSKGFSKWSDLFYRFINLQVKVLEDFKEDKNVSSFAKRNVDRSFRFFRQEAGVSYQYNRREKYQYYLSANYTKNFEYPSVDQLYTIVDDIYVYDIRMGNPNLLNKINHRLNLNLNFSSQNPKSNYSVNGNINGGYTRSLNPVTDSIINEASGKRRSYFINADKSSGLNLNYSLNISRKLKQSSLQLMYNGSANTSELPSYVDGVYTVSQTSGLSHNLTLQFSLRSLLIVNVGKSLQQYKSRQSAAGLNSFKNTNNTTKLGLTLNYPANFSIRTTLDHIDNSNLNKATVLWNAFASYRFMKQQGELKFSAMDMLKQYQNITNTASLYGTTTRITNGLQQYFLLSFSYYPRKFGKTEIKKQGGAQGY